MKACILSAWSELPDCALDLLAQAEQACPFSGKTWFEVFSRQIAAPGQQPQWLVLFEHETTVLLLPMLALSRGRTRVLSSFSNYYTPYFSPVSSSGNVTELLKILFEQVRDYLRGFDVLEFFPLTAETRTALLAGAHGGGNIADTQVHTWNWRERGIQGYAQYWSTRDSRLRNTVRRKQHKLDAIGDYRFSIAAPDTIEQAMEAYRRVYANSWKPEENFPDFIIDLIRTYAREGSLRLGLAYHANRAVAAQIWLVKARKAYIYKLAYDKDYRGVSVGTLLSHYLFRNAIEIDQVHTVDYLTGDDAYKVQWVSERRPLYRLSLINPRRPAGAVLILRQTLGRVINRFSR